MAVEAKRGCGYRKVGGLYLAGTGFGIACDRLPFVLHVCPTCSHGIKPTRGFTWVDAPVLFGGPHVDHVIGINEYLCKCAGRGCPLCKDPAILGRAGLLWIGEQFYKTAAEFEGEANVLGVSRRIATIPRGFEIGKTWILFAHRLGKKSTVTVDVPGALPGVTGTETKFEPAIFRVWLPQRIEQICVESQRGTDEIAALEKRGITPVFVPDNDPDHKGRGEKDEDSQPELFEKEA